EIATLSVFAWASFIFWRKSVFRWAFATGMMAGLVVGARYANVFVVAGWIAALWILETPRCYQSGRAWAGLLMGGLIPAVVQVAIWQVVWGHWRPNQGMYAMTGSNFY